MTKNQKEELKAWSDQVRSGVRRKIDCMKEEFAEMTAYDRVLDAVHELIAENDDLSRQIVTAVSDDMVSDFTVNSLNSFVDMATTYTFMPIREIAGEPVYSEDRSPEFYADEDALYQTVVDLFYLPLDAE